MAFPTLRRPLRPLSRYQALRRIAGAVIACSLGLNASAAQPQDDTLVLRRKIYRRIVGAGEGDDGFRSRQNQVWIDAFRCVACEPDHLALPTLVQPTIEVRGGFRRGGGGEPAGVEAQFERSLFNAAFHVRARVGARRGIDAGPAG